MDDTSPEKIKNRLKATIDKVVIQPTKIAPIIVNFINGEVAEKKAKKLKCNLLYDSKKQKRVLALSDNSIVYKGYQPDPKKSSTYTMFALHNKKTGKIRLIQAERWEVNPVLTPPDDLSDDEENNNETFAARTAMLNKQFGSKRMKRKTELYERMKIDVDSMAEQLRESVANVEVDVADLSTKAPEAPTETGLPPCNQDATSVENVYDLYDLIPRGILHSLVVAVEKIEEFDLSGQSKFYVETMKMLGSDHKRSRKIAMLEFITGVCRWLNVHPRAGKKIIETVCPLAPEVREYILKTYSMTSTTGRVRPASIKDRAVMHCIIIALMIRNYKLDLESFSDYMNVKLGVKKLISLARIVGAMPDKTNKNTVILKIPLPPPPQLVQRARKNK